MTEGAQLLAGRYEVGAPLGGTSDAFDAQDLLLRRPVVLAAIPDPGGAGRRQVRAARLATRIGHPGLVAVYDVVVEDGIAWVVVPLAAGVGLDDAVSEGPWRPSDVRAIGAELAEVLAAGHAAGLVHGHLEPARVAVTSGPRAQLSGFGVPAEPVDPPYLAPELVAEPTPTAAGDLWALGATLLLPLLGGPPSPGLLPNASDRGTSEARPRLEGGDPTLGRVVAALLDADPNLRPSAASVADLLRDDPAHQRLEHL